MKRFLLAFAALCTSICTTITVAQTIDIDQIGGHTAIENVLQPNSYPYLSPIIRNRNFANRPTGTGQRLVATSTYKGIEGIGNGITNRTDTSIYFFSGTNGTTPILNSLDSSKTFDTISQQWYISAINLYDNQDRRIQRTKFNKNGDTTSVEKYTFGDTLTYISKSGTSGAGYYRIYQSDTLVFDSTYDFDATGIIYKDVKRYIYNNIGQMTHFNNDFLQLSPYYYKKNYVTRYYDNNNVNFVDSIDLYYSTSSPSNIAYEKQFSKKQYIGTTSETDSIFSITNNNLSGTIVYNFNGDTVNTLRYSPQISKEIIKTIKNSQGVNLILDDYFYHWENNTWRPITFQHRTINSNRFLLTETAKENALYYGLGAGDSLITIFNYVYELNSFDNLNKVTLSRPLNNYAYTLNYYYTEYETPTSANNIKNNLNVSIFPVPVYTKLNIIINDQVPMDIIVTIYNISGKVVKTIETNNKKFDLDIQDLATGSYIIKLANQKTHKQYTSKFTKL